MNALHTTDVPVPSVVTYREDVSALGALFYVMEHIEGRTFRTSEDTGTLTESAWFDLAHASFTR